MAYKTASETITQFQKFVALDFNARVYLDGFFKVDTEAVADQLTVGDSTDEKQVQEAALKAVRDAARSFYSQLRQFNQTIAPTLGRLAGASTPSDVLSSLAKFNDYLVDNTKKLESRGLTKGAWSAVSGTGTGTVLELTTDPNSVEADISKVETLTLRCTKDSQTVGVTGGLEKFSLYGAEIGADNWLEGGSGDSGFAYSYPYGRGVKEFGRNWKSINTGEDVITCTNGEDTSQNLLGGGGFESAFSGTDTDKIAGVTIDSGETNFAQESTYPIKGTYSLRHNTTAAVLRWSLAAGGLKPKVPYGLTFLIAAVNDGAGTVTGSLTVKLKDDSTTHQTITVTVGSLTAASTIGTISRQSLTFIAPTNVGANLRIELSCPTYGGTSVTKAVIMDEFVLTELKQCGGGRAIAVVAGVTDFRYNDYFTAATTDAATGLNQKFINTNFGRYLHHGASATDWDDPTLEPEIQMYNSSLTAVASGGTIALGTTAISAQAVTVWIYNLGNAALACAVPTNGTNTNIASCTFNTSTPFASLPGNPFKLVVTVTPTGAGAYSTTVTIPNNDSSESTTTVVISGTAA